MKKLLIKMLYVLRAIETINRPKIGDIVSFRKQKYKLRSGHAAPIWSATNSQGDRELLNIEEVRFQPFYRRWIFSFKDTYNFFMEYWYKIHVCRNANLTEVRRLTKSVCK